MISLLVVELFSKIRFRAVVVAGVATVFFHLKELLLQLLVVFAEFFDLVYGVLSEAAHFLAQGIVFWWGAGAQIVVVLGVERVDGSGHGGILILECIDVLA